MPKTLIMILLLITACDQSTLDEAECLDLRPALYEPDELPAPQRIETEPPPPTRTPGVDPCVDYGWDPGLNLVGGLPQRVSVDWCIAAVPNVQQCYFGKYIWDPNGLHIETDELEIWCDFECVVGDPVMVVEQETVSIIAGYPAIGQVARIELVNPCPEVPEA